MPITNAGRLVLAAAAVAAIASSQAHAGGLVRLETALGPITVEPTFGERVVPVINGLAALGVRGHVKCFAPRPAPGRRGPHVANSNHYWGGACDVLPEGRQAKGRNRMPTPALMFTRQAAALIADAGLRNGCSFRDCGHIDAGGRRGSRLAAR